MPTIEATLWYRLSPEQRIRIIAILVRMLLQRWVQQRTEVAHDSA